MQQTGTTPVAHRTRSLDMPKPAPLAVTVSTVIPAVNPNAVYDLVADVTAMPNYSPETIEVTWLGNTTEATVGAKFKGTNKLGTLKWSTKPTITAAERGKVFGFKVPGKAGPTWTYEFEAVEGGTLVTETMHQVKTSPLPIRILQRRAGVTDRAENLRAAMTVTLERLSTTASAA
jgi:Polyketide cyclase / dehydrase and lipid transport